MDTQLLSNLLLKMGSHLQVLRLFHLRTRNRPQAVRSLLPVPPLRLQLRLLFLLLLLIPRLQENLKLLLGPGVLQSLLEILQHLREQSKEIQERIVSSPTSPPPQLKTISPVEKPKRSTEEIKKFFVKEHVSFLRKKGKRKKGKRERRTRWSVFMPFALVLSFSTSSVLGDSLYLLYYLLSSGIRSLDVFI